MSKNEVKHSPILSLQECKDKTAKENGWNSFDEYYQQGNKLDVLVIMHDVVELHSSQYKEKTARLKEQLKKAREIIKDLTTKTKPGQPPF